MAMACCNSFMMILCETVERCELRIGRTSGYVVMLELMKRLAAKADPPFGVATMNEPR